MYPEQIHTILFRSLVEETRVVEWLEMLAYGTKERRFESPFGNWRLEYLSVNRAVLKLGTYN